MPLFNEEAVIGSVVEGAIAVFPHIVCVDDGSSDDSAARAHAAGAVVLRHPVNLGQGAALQTGIDYALAQPDCDYLVTFDADGQHQVADAAAMVHRLETEPLDVVLGSRFLDTRTELGWLKRLVLRTAVLFERAGTGIKLTDAHNGLRAFARSGASRIQIHQNRMAHASEIVSEIAKNKLRYAEQPVHVVYNDYSKAKGQSVWNSINIISDLFLN
ncbi:MAG TPA: glycosyltransferase family 2 protein [Gryllotalpicola sp.]